MFKTKSERSGVGWEDVGVILSSEFTTEYVLAYEL